MIDSFIDKNKQAFKYMMLAFIIIPIIANGLFSNSSFNKQIENLLLSILMVLIGGAGAFIVLGLQVINPGCTRRVLKFACNFFLIFASLSILLAFIPLLWFCVCEQQGIDFFYYVLFGLLIVTNWIREKYAIQSSRFKQ
jgi:hypothetical protein